MKTTESSETCDAILGGEHPRHSAARGYRFSVDSILLARFVKVRKIDRVLELGRGYRRDLAGDCALYHPREIVALEIQPQLVAMLRRNAELNRIESIRAVAADLRQMPSKCRRKLRRRGRESSVSSKQDRPRNSPDEGRRIARSESSATLEDFIAAASRCTRRGGKAAFVFAADRSAELISMLREHHLEPKRIRFVHPFANTPAAAILVEARKYGGIEVAIEPPLILFDAPGVYSREAREILGEVASPSPAE